LDKDALNQKAELSFGRRSLRYSPETYQGEYTKYLDDDDANLPITEEQSQ
jgi:hypothetical protein